MTQGPPPVAPRSETEELKKKQRLLETAQGNIFLNAVIVLCIHYKVFFPGVPLPLEVRDALKKKSALEEILSGDGEEFDADQDWDVNDEEEMARPEMTEMEIGLNCFNFAHCLSNRD